LINDGAWHNLVVMLNETGTKVTLWHDGVKVNDTTVTALNTQAGGFLVGQSVGGVGFEGWIDEVYIYNETLTETEILLFNSSFYPTFADAGQGVNVTVQLYTPQDDNVSNLLTKDVTHKFTTTTADSALTNCSLWTNESGSFIIEAGIDVVVNGSNNTILNSTGRTDVEGTVLWNVQCCTSGECAFASSNFSMLIDTTSPVITGKQLLEDNRTILIGDNLSTFINFSDDREVYSINVTLDDGLILFNATNMAVLNFTVRVNTNISNASAQALTARVCDAHTAQSITIIESKVESDGVKFVTESNWLGTDTEWYSITPENTLSSGKACIVKYKEKYGFTLKTASSYLVESTHSIDIIGSNNYQGHLVIPGLGKNGYWIDFENEIGGEVTRVDRVSPTKVRVWVNGLTGDLVTFKSTGELNCVSRTFRIGVLNPSFGFTTPVVVGTSNNFTFDVTIDPLTMSGLNTTLFYNNTVYYTGVTSNFSQLVPAPTSVPNNATNLTFLWSVEVPGQELNLTSLLQEVRDFTLDDCSSNSVLTWNFTFFNESGSNNAMTADYTATFNYTFGSTKKQLTLTGTDEPNITVCMFPQGQTFTGTYDIAYSQTGHSQRRVTDDSVTYSNVTQNQNLFLIADSDAIAFSFSVVDNFASIIEGVLVTMSKGIELIESRETDGAGNAGFIGESDTSYGFVFTKTGFETFTTTITPNSGDKIQIRMNAPADQENASFSQGVGSKVSPLGRLLQNNTLYNFSINVTSNFWEITSCFIMIKNNTDILQLHSPTFNVTHCLANISFNTGTQTNIFSQMNYTLNTSAMLFVRQPYTVGLTYEGEFSLMTWITDIKSFSKAGFDDFTRMIMALLIIIVIVSSASFSVQGLRNSTGIIIMTAVLVCMFSFLGFFTLNNAGLPTAWLRQYMISLLTVILGLAYVIKYEVAV